MVRFGVEVGGERYIPIGAALGGSNEVVPAALDETNGGNIPTSEKQKFGVGLLCQRFY